VLGKDVSDLGHARWRQKAAFADNLARAQLYDGCEICAREWIAVGRALPGDCRHSNPRDTATMSGKIITFYSYKGGTGRTMAISNVAWILASNSYRVLLIDWDLESPGLHRYLRAFLADPELTESQGLIDFLCDAAATSTMMQVGPSRRARFSSFKEYTVDVNWTFRGGGSIDFLPAGRQDKDYAQRVGTFDWRKFWEQLGGRSVLQAARAELKANYDYVLIDSQTGLSEVASICTVEMPDVLVVPFTLNRQNINGAAAVMASVRAQREQELPIFPIPTRIETGETDKRAAAIAYARQVFAPFLTHLQSDRRVIDAAQQAAYWRDVETPYVSYYAFEEVPAAFKDEAGSPRGVRAANERIAYWITNRTLTSHQTESEERRRAIVEAYSFGPDDSVASDFQLPIRPSGPLHRIVGVVDRQLRRHAWRYATAILAGMILLVGVYANNRSSQIAAASSQLTDVMSTLHAVQAEVIASGLDKNADLERNFTAALNKLSEIQHTLNDVKGALRLFPPPARQDLPTKQTPSTPTRQ
jgi:MinD-like ATPase involved in chromosome partitioning or flagellar assembly